MASERQSGGCQCGAVRFSTSGQPVRTLACHCQTCKQRTGAAYGVGVYFRQDDVEFNGGELQTFEYCSAESGRWIRNEFCPKCGATVTWTLEMRPGMRALAGGCFDHPDWFVIEAHIWTDAARSDMRFADTVAVHGTVLPPS